MLKILGRNNSVNVMKVTWAAEELGLPFERVDIGGEFGGNDQPDYLAMNPNGKVPTIIDGDLVLWESNAIVRYLTAKHDMGGLCPQDLGVRADLDRWMDWSHTELSNPMRDVFWGLVRTPPEKRNHDQIKAGVVGAAAAFRKLDARLEGRPFVGGDKLTMAEFPLGGFVHRWFGCPIEDRPEDMPNLRAWYDRLCARPAFRKHIADIPIT
jgi:glutathione S-transferase